MPDLAEQLDHIMPTALVGSVAQTVGTTISAAGFPAPVGAVAEIQRQSGVPLLAEVVGFRDDLTVLYPLSDLRACAAAIACGWCAPRAGCASGRSCWAA